MFQIWVFTEVDKSVNNSIGSIDFRLFDPWATTAPLILSRMLEDTPVFYRVKETLSESTVLRNILIFARGRTTYFIFTKMDLSLSEGWRVAELRVVKRIIVHLVHKMYIILLKGLVFWSFDSTTLLRSIVRKNTHTHTHTTVLHERNVWRYNRSEAHLRVRDTTKWDRCTTNLDLLLIKKRCRIRDAVKVVNAIHAQLKRN